VSKSLLVHYRESSEGWLAEVGSSALELDEATERERFVVVEAVRLQPPLQLRERQPELP
jgi:hypothetical protein